MSTPPRFRCAVLSALKHDYVARGMAEDDVRARIAAQLPLEERSRAADVLLDNEGSLEDLEREVDVLWRELMARAGAHA